MKRYTIQAKRKGTNEKWSEWTNENYYDAAIKHVSHIEDDLGQCGRIVYNDDGIEELWGLLGGDKELADKILDAKFRKEHRVMEETLNRIIIQLNAIIFANEKALRQAKEDENADDTLLYATKKAAFLEVKEMLLKGGAVK